jgi:hypothetical protein
VAHDHASHRVRGSDRLGYGDLADELEQLALLHDLEPPRGMSLSDVPALAFGEDLSLPAADLERVAELEAR